MANLRFLSKVDSVIIISSINCRVASDIQNIHFTHNIQRIIVNTDLPESFQSPYRECRRTRLL